MALSTVAIKKRKGNYRGKKLKQLNFRSKSFKKLIKCEINSVSNM